MIELLDKNNNWQLLCDITDQYIRKKYGGKKI